MAGTTVRELITKILFKTDKGSITAVNKSVKRTKSLMKGAARSAKALKNEIKSIIPGIRGFIAALVTARATQWLTVDFAKEADAAAKFAKATGVGIETYQGLAHAVQLAGGDVGDLNKSLQQIGKRALEVTQGNKTMARTFRELGVSVLDDAGKLKGQDELLRDIADSMMAMEDGSRKTGLALQVGGRSFARLIPLLNEGAAGIEKYIAEAKKLGIVLTKDQAQAAEDFNDEMLRAKSVLKGLRNLIAVELLPAITQQFMAFRQWAVEGDNMQRMLRGVKTAAKIAGAALAVFVTVKTIKVIGTMRDGLKDLRNWLALTGRAAWLNATVNFKLMRRAMSLMLVPGRNMIKLLKRMRTWLIAVGAASGISAKALLFFKGVMSGVAGAGKAAIRMLKFLALSLIRVGKAALFAGGKVGLIIASMAFLVLLIQDLVVFAQGGDSLFGRLFADTEFGETTLYILGLISKEAKQLGKEVGGLARDVGKELKKLAIVIDVDLSDVVAALGWVLKALLIIMLSLVFGILKALTFLVQKIRQIPQAARDAFAAYKTAMDDAATFIAEKWAWLVGKIKGALSSIGSAAKTVWGGLETAAATVAKAIAGAFAKAADSTKIAWTEVGAAIKRAWNAVKNEVLFQFTRVKDAVGLGGMTGSADFSKNPFLKGLGGGGGSQTTTVTGGPVSVTIQGQTNMGPGEVGGAVQGGMDSWWDGVVSSLIADVRETPA